MNERSRVGLWIGLAAVAVIGLLAVGARHHDRSGESSASSAKANHGDATDEPLEAQRAAGAVGHASAAPSKSKTGVGATPNAKPQTEAEREEARALTAKRYKAAQFSRNRIEYETEEVRPSDTVFDLCDDVQAREAGLAFNALDDDRHSLGIDCRTSDHRFGYIAGNEALRFANTYGEAQALLKEYATKGSIKGEKFQKPIGTLMGHRGPWPVDMGLALDPCGEGFGCAAASIDISRGSTRGVFANVSEDVAHDVTISAGNVVVHHPLSVQPGESSAFELPGELSAADLATLNISASFVASPDPRRSVRLMAAPGDITGPRAELAKSYYGIDPAGAPPEITYFLEAFMVERSTSHPEAALPGGVLDAPTAVVALLDTNLKVIGVLRPLVTFEEEGAKPAPTKTMAASLTYTIGFVRPPEAGQVFISIGGAE